MSDEKVIKESAPTVDSAKKPFARNAGGKRPFAGKRGPGGKDSKGGKKFAERPKPEFDQKILSIRRVTRVMAGGRRFSFSVSMLIGDRKGSVGIGLGKSSDTTLAISKAVASARKNMVKIHATKEMSIAHDVQAKYKASEVFIMPNKGKGVVAGGAVRDILNLAGLKNVTGKLLSRSKNQLNNARATVRAFAKLKA
ncbi:MAG: small subunit ribosomal protein [Patescibacteria group bacterium]|jgi:small subunit ribosomal protein S5|nr:small subunit ribosomal protein [Patescibacteria group bacterium]